jgi:acetyltransferase-like isoleucine patch superfamily enzyme
VFKSVLKFLVLKLKGRTISFDDSVRNVDLFALFIGNFFCILRGFIRLRGLVLLGDSVKLNAKYNLKLGKGVTIGASSTLNAMGKKGIIIGTGSSIGAFSVIKVSGTLTSLGEGICIGSNVGIGEFAHIGGAGGVVIGDNTIVGAYFSVHPENHIFTDKNRLIRDQGVSRKGISIGNNCWIGAKVTILDGTNIGDGCVVAAGAVVKGKFHDNVVIGGVPARVLKEI